MKYLEIRKTEAVMKEARVELCFSIYRKIISGLVEAAKEIPELKSHGGFSDYINETANRIMKEIVTFADGMKID